MKDTTPLSCFPKGIVSWDPIPSHLFLDFLDTGYRPSPLYLPFYLHTESPESGQARNEARVYTIDH